MISEPDTSSVSVVEHGVGDGEPAVRSVRRDLIIIPGSGRAAVSQFRAFKGGSVTQAMLTSAKAGQTPAPGPGQKSQRSGDRHQDMQPGKHPDRRPNRKKSELLARATLDSPILSQSILPTSSLPLLCFISNHTLSLRAALPPCPARSLAPCYLCILRSSA